MRYASQPESLPHAQFASGDRMPGPECRVSFALVRALLEVVQASGVAQPAQLGPLAAEASSADHTGGFVSRSEFKALLARAIALTGDAALGLHCGLRASEASFGLMAPLIAHSPNLRRGIELATQFQPLLVEGLQLSLLEDAGVAQLRCELELPGADDRSFVELQMAGLVRAIQALGCPRSEIRAVCFEHRRPFYHHAYTSAFGGTERFEQPYCGVEFLASTLDAPHLHRDWELHSLILSQAEHNLRRSMRQLSFTERVRRLIHGRPVSEIPDMVAASDKLGLSVRSLRRYLEEEGVSFRELKQAQLRDAACSMLRNPALSLQEIARELGFSEVSTFHRAFRRWANATPAQYRSTLLVPSQSDVDEPRGLVRHRPAGSAQEPVPMFSNPACNAALPSARPPKAST